MATNDATNTPLHGEQTIAASSGTGSTTTLPPREEQTTKTPVKSRRGFGLRRIILGLVVLIILIVGGTFGYNYYLDSQRYVSSDDALVDSNLVAVASPGSGTLTIWRVKPGDVVKAGQVLGTVQPPPGAASYISVKAPIDGTIIRVDGKEGQVVGAAQSIAYVADLKHLTVTAYIDETQIERLKPGQQVDVTVDATGSTSYRGTVKEILPATASEFALIQTTDRGTGNFTKVTQRIEIHIDLGDTSNLPLYPGENAYVRVHVV